MYVTYILYIYITITSVVAVMCKQQALLKVKDIWYVSFQRSDILHPLPVFSYIFFLQSQQAVEWRLEWHHFSDACCSWKSSTDELFLEQNTFATICSWIVCHVTALICVPLLHLRLLICANNKRCWKLKTFDMSSFSLTCFAYTACVLIYGSLAVTTRVEMQLERHHFSDACCSWTNK